MMRILESVFPIIALLGLGSLLAHIRFLGESFIADLNKLAFWVALPALLFRSAAHAGEPGAQTLDILLILSVATLIIGAIGYWLPAVLRVPRNAWGTISQSAFRGNLAYIGIPVLAYSLEGGKSSPAFASGVIVMTLLMSFYNVIAVPVLGHGKLGMKDLFKSVATNPLLIGGLAGLLYSLTPWEIPVLIDRPLEAVANSAVAIALMCIGGQLRLRPLSGSGSAIALAAVLKVAALPLLTAGLCLLWGIGPAETRVATVLAATPTAAAAYVMASQLGGDESIASGSIAVSTVLSAISLAIVLWLT